MQVSDFGLSRLVSNNTPIIETRTYGESCCKCVYGPAWMDDSALCVVDLSSGMLCLLQPAPLDAARPQNACCFVCCFLCLHQQSPHRHRHSHATGAAAGRDVVKECGCVLVGCCGVGDVLRAAAVRRHVTQPGAHRRMLVAGLGLVWFGCSTQCSLTVVYTHAQLMASQGWGCCPRQQSLCSHVSCRHHQPITPNCHNCHNKHTFQVLHAIGMGRLLELPSDMPPGLKGLLGECLSRDPAKR